MNTIKQGDCIRELKRLPAGSVDLVFADPPFNIGYAYDVYTDSLPFQQYLDWSREWMQAVHRVLKDNGTFWLAIGDEYAAELKIEARNIGFHCRSWVIWYYTFGVNCSRKFTRSHTHLFYFVKNPHDFVFRAEAPENRIPSARQLVYHDNRANPRGRLPDDTWIIRPADAAGEMTGDEMSLLDLTPEDHDHTWTLRPQDLADRFRPDEDTWYFPRVAGTFKERAGFHGCQMPEQLLGRIIRTCSEPGAIVLDPFSGSGTTAAVAKKLGRRFLAFDLSEEYVRLGLERLQAIRVGDPLDGAPEPLVSAPSTAVGRSRGGRCSERRRNDRSLRPEARACVVSDRQYRLTEEGIVAAFAATHEGFSADRVVVDPDLNQRFLAACREKGLVGGPRSWNMLLFRLRKSGRLVHLPTRQRTLLGWADCDPFLFASEIAWRMLLDQERAESLDEILCDPEIAAEFDRIAGCFAPGYSSLQYRWAALKLRKQSKLSRVRADSLARPPKLGRPVALDDFDPQAAPPVPGVYLVGHPRSAKLYAGEAINLHSRLRGQFAQELRELWRQCADERGVRPRDLKVWLRPMQATASEMLAWQTCLIRQYQPHLNLAVGQ